MWVSNNVARKGAFLTEKYKHNRAAVQQASNSIGNGRSVNHYFNSEAQVYPCRRQTKVGVQTIG